MNRSLSRYTIASAVAACTVLGACQKKGDVAVNDTTAAPAMANRTDTTASGGAVSSTNAGAKNDWTDAQIVAFASAASAGEVSEGQMAEHKATNPAVKSFARQMVTDHTKMLADTRAIEKKLMITPDSSKSDVKDLMKNGQDDIKDLTNKKAGKDWDEAYISKQIDDHQKVLDKLNDAQQSAKSADLKTALTQSIAKVQEHLNKAKSIKDNTLKS